MNVLYILYTPHTAVFAVPLLTQMLPNYRAEVKP